MWKKCLLFPPAIRVKRINPLNHIYPKRKYYWDDKYQDVDFMKDYIHKQLEYIKYVTYNVEYNLEDISKLIKGIVDKLDATNTQNMFTERRLNSDEFEIVRLVDHYSRELMDTYFQLRKINNNLSYLHTRIVIRKYTLNLSTKEWVKDQKCDDC